MYLFNLTRTLAQLSAVVAFCVPATAQNLLDYRRWTTINPQYVKNLRITATRIEFSPHHSGTQRGTCGLEQTVTVPTDGVYQCHFQGWGGVTGTFAGVMEIDGQRRKLEGYPRQEAWSVRLQAGQRRVRFLTDTSDDITDRWSMDHPILQRAVAPTIELTAMSEGPPTLEARANAHVLLLGAKKASSPIRILGFGYVLDLEPSQVFVVLVSGTGKVHLDLNTFVYFFSGTLPAFELQALALGSAPTFGSRVHVFPRRY